MLAKIIVFSLYAILIIGVGLNGLRKTKSFNDFFLGGGNIGPWMSAFSYGSAYFSAVLFIGFAGKFGWSFGLSSLWIALFNALVGVLGVWLFMGWKIKKMSIDYGVSTMSEFLEKRYNFPLYKLLATIVIFVFLIPYSAAVFMGLSYLFESSLGLPYVWVLVIIGVFASTYIMLGGYKSIAMIDMVFGIIKIACVILLMFVIINKGGGVNNIFSQMRNIDPKLTQSIGPAGFWQLFSIVMLTSLAPFAMPQLVQKFYAIKDRKSIRIGMFASTAFALIITGIAYFIGSTTRVFINAETFPDIFENGKPIYDRLMPELLTTVIPDSLSIIILVLILSASMSTLASLVLISSSAVSRDLYFGFINKNVSDKNLTIIMRVMSGVFVLFAILLALAQFDVIVEILGVSWGALGSFFLGPFVWGLFSKKVNRFGAISSSIVGLSFCLVLYFIGVNADKSVNLEWYYTSPGAGTVGMIISLLTTPLFSLFSKK